MFESTVEFLILPVTGDPVFDYFFTLVVIFGFYAVFFGVIVKMVMHS
ncbi:MAG: hypothetical protein AB7S75_13340 [Desulfococcaceae bacterium]